MKHRPIYFAAAFLLLLLICTAYNLSYHYITGDPPSAEESADHESETMNPSISIPSASKSVKPKGP